MCQHTWRRKAESKLAKFFARVLKILFISLPGISLKAENVRQMLEQWFHIIWPTVIWPTVIWPRANLAYIKIWLIASWPRVIWPIYRVPHNDIIGKVWLGNAQVSWSIDNRSNDFWPNDVEPQQLQKSVGQANVKKLTKEIRKMFNLLELVCFAEFVGKFQAH